jgi:hypothetical protein
MRDHSYDFDGGADMPSARISVRLLGVYFNVLSMDEVLRLIATRPAGAPFAYVVELWPKLGDGGLRKAAYRGG